MSTYVFEPDHLQQVVQMHISGSVDQRFERISETLHNVYGEHVHPEGPWSWSNAGGIMCSMRVLHASPREYLLFCGSTHGTAGHSGNHRAEMWDIVVAGELRTHQPNQFDATLHEPGDLSYLPRRTSNASHLGPGCWLLEYGRGNVFSLFPFALGDSLFSTQDLSDVGKALSVSTRLMWSEMKIALRHRIRRTTPVGPKLEHITADAPSRPHARA